MCIHCSGHFSSLPPSNAPSLISPHFQAEPVLPSTPILLKRRYKW
jgi:hypothetical protein